MQRVKPHACVEVLVDYEIVRGPQQQGVTVRLGAHYVHGAYVATRTGLVVHHQRLPESRLQTGKHLPQDQVSSRSSRIGYDDADGHLRPRRMGK